jgi:broad specificity phosphatase PhoE
VLELVYETHSMTVDNEEGRATGWLPGVLSEAGREQARGLGARRRDDGLDAVFSSDLARAVETARIAFEGSEIPFFLDWRLRECNYGELNGSAVAEIDALRAWKVDEPYPGGESYRQVVERVASFIADVAASFEGGRVLLISHAAPRWAIQHLLERRPLEELVVAPFEWQEGWLYRVDPGQTRRG